MDIRPKAEGLPKKDLSKVLENLRKKSRKMVISEEEYHWRRKRRKGREFFYCKKVKNSPFGKGNLKDIKFPERDTLYVFAKQYAFYLSKEFGLVKILYFANDLQYNCKQYHKNNSEINFDESNLILVQEQEVKNGEK